MLRILFSVLFFVLPTLFALPVRAGAEPVRVGHVQIELVSGVKAVRPGSTFYAALRVIHDDGWHTYWISSTTGFPPSVEWELPDGITADALQHPVPDVYEQGGIVDFVHKGEVFYPVRIHVADSVKEGQTLALKAKVLWLVCSDICVPGDASLSLELPVSGADAEPSEWSPFIQKTLAQVKPAAGLPGLALSSVYSGGGEITLSVHSPVADTGPLFFMSSDGLLAASTYQEQIRDSDGNVTMRLPLSEYAPDLSDASAAPMHLRGILLASKGWGNGVRALQVDQSVDVEDANAPHPGDRALLLSPLPAIIFAFLGGLILNLMPCVFPVLGLKVMAFVNMAGGSRRKAWMHALVFTLGVMATLLLLAGLLLILRSTGAHVGWGFQLQNPVVLFAGAVIFLLFALNMNGVYEVGLSATGAGSELQNKKGYAGAFFTGVLAVVVATPCSAPFLGSAIGFALTGSTVRLLLIFVAVGLGFSLPYLLLAAFPSLLRLLPRPGRWMVVLKHILSVLLYATVLYLLWALIPFVGRGYGLVFVAAGLLLVAIAAFVYGRWMQPHNTREVRWLAFSSAALIFSVGILVGCPSFHSRQGLSHDYVSELPVPAFSADGSGPHWTRWRPGLAAELAQRGNIVWVDFTARWCTTCQVNKAVLFRSDRIRDYFRENRVIALKADWTEQDEEISQELARWNRFAVPFNLIYLPNSEVPVEMPTILTPGIVLDAMEKRGEK